MKHIDDERLIAYLEGDLSEGEKLLVERHLAECNLCRENLKVYSRLMGDIESLPPIIAPSRLDEMVLPRRNILPALIIDLMVSGLLLLSFYLVLKAVTWLLKGGWISIVMSRLVDAIIDVARAYAVLVSLVNPLLALVGVGMLSLFVAAIMKRRLERYVELID